MPDSRKSIRRMLQRVSLMALFFCLPYSVCSAANSKPAVGTINPSSGSSNPYQQVLFETTYSDANGWQDMQHAYLLINSSTTKSSCFYGYYKRDTNQLYLRDSANRTWLGGFAPGSANIIENNQVKLYCAQTTVSGSGNILSISWAVAFKTTFTGTKNTYLYVKDTAGAYAGWTQKGSWQINPNSAPTADSVSPSKGLKIVGVPVSFTTTYSDANGWEDIKYAYFRINASSSGLNCFYSYYDQNNNKLYLRDDSNSAWLGGYAPGSSNIIENSYATLNCEKTTVSGSGTLLVVHWLITFKSTFTGAKNLYLYVKDDANAYQGWLKKGTLNIQLPDSVPPTGSIKINNDAQYTNSVSVTLSLSAQDNAGGLGLAKMRFSNDGSTWSAAQAYAATKAWTLTAGNGTKTVYAKFSDKAGNWSDVYSDTILLDAQVPVLNPIGAKSVNENQNLEFTISASDPDADALTYTAADLPEGAVFDQITQTFSWTPDPTQGREDPYRITFAVSDGVLGDSEEVAITVADLNIYAAIVDDHDKPLPTSGYNFNYTGGDRGLLNIGDNTYSWDGTSAYKAEVTHQSGSWTYGGMFYSLIRIDQDNIPLNFSAVFGPYVKPEYQAKITGISITVNSVASPAANHNLTLKVELKDANGNLAHTPWLFTDLIAQQYPKTFQVNLASENIGNVEVLAWSIDKAVLQDAIIVDKVTLEIKTPDLLATETKDQAFLWTYGWLMANYDPLSGMVQDRSNFYAATFENVTATAKAAKVVYYAFKKGYTSQYDATTIITKIANTLINVLPRGPAGINTIWPHFTKNGGIERVPGTEWASGDTVYAALDIITTLQMIGDPQNQIPALEQFLREIDWTALILPDGSISHGYAADNTRFPNGWAGFGMESIGVNWAYASATGNTATMTAPPSDNGSGFNDNAQYPMVFSATDKWGNDWDSYRDNTANTQIDWYANGRNNYLYSAGLFGLSAAENPEANMYQGYGIGGKQPAEDGNAEVITLHYSAMISDIRPADAKRVWDTLRDRDTAFLENRIIISPLNNMESMRVDKTTGKCTVNYLKGSWNLALQAEGWALADANLRADLLAAVQNNPFLKQGYDILKTATTPAPVLRVPQDYPTIQAAIDVAQKGDTILVASGTYQENILLNKSGIILQGAGNPIIQGTSDSAVIFCQDIDTDETLIKGFEITGGAYGIKCAGTVKTLKIQGNQIKYNLNQMSGYGIYLESWASAVIEGNNITYSARGIQSVGNNKVDIINNYFYYCRGSYGGGVSLESGTDALIKGNTFIECWDGAINIYDSRADIIGNRISSNGSWNKAAGLNIQDSIATLKNNIIRGNSCFNIGEGGLEAYSSTVDMFNNIFYANNGLDASDVYVYNTNFKAKNNIFYKSYGVSSKPIIFFNGNTSQEFSYNDLWDNTGPVTTRGISLGVGNIESDPLFVDQINFHLNPLSPCINTGDPDPQFNDKDGTRNDMGVYGGPHSL